MDMKNKILSEHNLIACNGLMNSSVFFHVHINADGLYTQMNSCYANRFRQDASSSLHVSFRDVLYEQDFDPFINAINSCCNN
jgi:hypothetical protein